MSEPTTKELIESLYGIPQYPTPKLVWILERQQAAIEQFQSDLETLHSMLETAKENGLVAMKPAQPAAACHRCADTTKAWHASASAERERIAREIEALDYLGFDPQELARRIRSAP